MIKRIPIIFVLIIAFFTQANAVEQTKRKIVKVQLSQATRMQMEQFHKLGLDVTALNQETQTAHILLTDEEIGKIKAIGLEPEITLADADSIAREIRQSGYLDNYQSYEEIVQEIRTVQNTYPEIVKVYDIGDTYEKSVDRGGFDIWALKLSDNVEQDEDEPEVLYFANIHAREIITPKIILHFLNYMVSNYQKNPYVTYLIDNREIWLVPSTNPDGYEFVLSGSDPRYSIDPIWWRKNKRDNNNNGVMDYSYSGYGDDGVDLNRNFGYKWGDDNGSSGTFFSALYRGTEAFSEPESQAIRDLTLAHEFKISLSFHSYSQLWLYPWGYAVQTITPDHASFVALGDSCVAYNGYIPELAAELYPVSGDSDDWLYGEQTEKNKIFAFTPEVGNFEESLYDNTGFFPKEEFIEKQILENQGPMLFCAYAAGEEPIIIPDLQPSTKDTVGPYIVFANIRKPILLTTESELVESSFKLYFNTDGLGAPFDSTEMIATGRPEEHYAEIPALGDNLRIYYYLQAQNERGVVGHAPRSAPLAVYNFTVSTDSAIYHRSSPPVITGTTIPEYQANESGPYSIYAKITDNSYVASATLNYYMSSADEVTSVPMLPFGQVYAGEIPGQPFGTTVHYFIEAIDDSGFVTTDPCDAPDSTYSFLVTAQAPVAIVYPDTFEFEIEIGENIADSLWIKNKGFFPLEFAISGKLADSFEIVFSPEAGVVPAEDSLLIAFFIPSDSLKEGNSPFEIFINSNDAVNPEIKINGIINVKNIASVDNELTNLARPDAFSVSPNFPNPFNPETTIKYQMPVSSQVLVRVFNLNGQLVKILRQETQAAGEYQVQWDGTNAAGKRVSSGMYLFSFQAGDFRQTQKMLFLQ